MKKKPNNPNKKLQSSGEKKPNNLPCGMANLQWDLLMMIMIMVMIMPG
jgi:hypothetical protein